MEDFKITVKVNEQPVEFTRKAETLNLEDTINAFELQRKQEIRYKKEEASEQDIKNSVKDVARFISQFFNNEFTLDQAMKGISPKAMLLANKFMLAAMGDEVDEPLDEEENENLTDQPEA